jgi:hypothetical protein
VERIPVKLSQVVVAAAEHCDYEPASVPFGHDAKEQDQEHSDRDDDDGMRITAKGRI